MGNQCPQVDKIIVDACRSMATDCQDQTGNPNNELVFFDQTQQYNEKFSGKNSLYMNRHLRALEQR